VIHPPLLSASSIQKHHEKALREIVDQAQGVVGVAAMDLSDGERWGENTDFLFPQASAIKVPILMEVYK
jgi:beta-lactamase class A